MRFENALQFIDCKKNLEQQDVRKYNTKFASAKKNAYAADFNSTDN